jgi:hypothetical protein
MQRFSLPACQAKKKAMRKLFQTLIAFLLFTPAFAQQQSNTVNAIIGDISFLEKYGELPGENTDENLRISTHLQYVEKILRNADLSKLTEAQKTNRSKALDLLHEYTNNSIFPANHDYEERRPCFIDRDGNICAVGYLVEKTVGRDVAEAINTEHQYDFLLEMNDGAVAGWAEKFGFTLEECAMIQPSYGPPTTSNTRQVPIEKSYGIASGAVGGLGLASTMINLSARGAGVKWAAFTGLAAGTAQIILGVNNIKKDEVIPSIGGWPVANSYKSQNHLSYINIAAGTTAILTSAFNLWLNKKFNKGTALNVYSTTGINNKISAGLSFAKAL